jgi:hypothetical protein
MSPKKPLLIILCLAIRGNSQVVQLVEQNPSTTQTITQPVGTVLNVNNLGNVRYADQYSWQQTPVSPSTLAAGSNTVTLATCPLGVNGTDTAANLTPHWLYITAAGGDTNPNEPVLITGGTCTSGNPSGGSIIFLAAFSHIVGYKIGTATGGLQEAERESARSGNRGVIQLPINQITQLFAPFTISQTGLTVDGKGATLQCNFWASCLQLGDVTNHNSIQWLNTTLSNFTVQPGLSGWQVTPSAPASIAAGTTTITLTIPNCPAGFYAAIPNQLLWLNGTSAGLFSTPYGSGEPVFVTGGTCKPGTVNGTIVIKSAIAATTPSIYAHGAGYTLSSGVNSAIEDSSEDSTMQNIAPGSPTGISPAPTFGAIFQVDNDQGAKIRDYPASAYPFRCDPDFCSSIVFSPGPFSINAGIGWLTSDDLSCQTKCHAISWYSGNDIHVTDSVIQGYNEYGMKFSKNLGGFGYADLKSAYSEIGSVTNALDPALGFADVIDQGYNLTRIGPDPPATGFIEYQPSTTGQTLTQYYVVYKNSLGNKSVAVPIGFAEVNDPSASHVAVKFYTGTSLGTAGAVNSYDILRVQNVGTTGISAPTGTGLFAVATGLIPNTPSGNWAGCNTKGVCTFTDAVPPGSLMSYTNSDYSGGGGNNWLPSIEYSFGSTIATTAGNTNASPSSGYPSVAGNLGCAVTVLPPGFPYVNLYERFDGLGGFCPGLMRSQIVNSFFPVSSESLFPASFFENAQTGTGSQSIRSTATGRINFGGAVLTTSPSDMITVWDSNEAATQASVGVATGPVVGGGPSGLLRRPLVASDSGIGMEVPTNSGNMMLHAPGLNLYSGSVPDGSSWKAQIGSALITFKEPFSTNSQITSTLATGTAPLVVSSTTPVSNLTTVPLTYSKSGSQQTSVHIVQDSITLVAGAGTVTLTASAVFTSSSSYTCTAVRSTSLNAFKIVNNSGTSFTFTSASNTDTDTVRFVCVGN